MSIAKRMFRTKIREATFERDGHVCKQCGNPSDEMDAHHITPRKEMPYGGYVLENLVSLCPKCHEGAERYLRDLAQGKRTPFPRHLRPNTLYFMIDSSYDEAYLKCKEKENVGI